MANSKELRMAVEFKGAETTNGDGVTGSGHLTSSADSTDQVLSMTEAIVGTLASGVFKELRPFLPEDGGRAADMATAILILKAIEHALDTFLLEEGMVPDKVRNIFAVLYDEDGVLEGVQHAKVS